jgi:hypothetical protein
MSPSGEARIRSQVNLCGICTGQGGTETRYSLSTSTFPCTIAPMLHIFYGRTAIVGLLVVEVSRSHTHQTQ